ncbi:MAG: hypothetical protein M1817_005841 [Caeruleum heppii]|nr:MAG: hypothetical protein M1817_005841 [Caeruleum heppii]
MIIRQHLPLLAVLTLSFIGRCAASVGDQLPEFQDCVEICIQENCQDGDAVLPLHLRLLLWTCPAECDYTCQHITTSRRLTQHLRPSHPHKKKQPPPLNDPIVQYHGKWPFHRHLGLQEPFSVLFSLLNLLAHLHGLSTLRKTLPKHYPLLKYYRLFGYIGSLSWVCSCIFHARDTDVTEKMDYFAAGGSVLYGLYYTPIRIWRLDGDTEGGEGGGETTTTMTRRRKAALLRAWTGLCLSLYAAHVFYLTCIRWSYSYNMGANITVGTMTNILWTTFSLRRYFSSSSSSSSSSFLYPSSSLLTSKPSPFSHNHRQNKKGTFWTAWPPLIIAWLCLAMSLEVLDFPPLGGYVDAHALWHAGTVGPTVWWYRFLVRDALEDVGRGRGGGRVKV